VQLLRDPQTLALLRGQHAAGCVPALILQARQHLVEGGGQLAHLGLVTPHWHTLAGTREVHPASQRGERLERAERPVQQHQVDHHHERERGRQHERLAGGEGVQLPGREHQDRDGAGADHHRGVERGDALEQRRVLPDTGARPRAGAVDFRRRGRRRAPRHKHRSA
jgi:hypothetical protein